MFFIASEELNVPQFVSFKLLWLKHLEGNAINDVYWQKYDWRYVYYLSQLFFCGEYDRCINTLMIKLILARNINKFPPVTVYNST